MRLNQVLKTFGAASMVLRLKNGPKKIPSPTMITHTTLRNTSYHLSPIPVVTLVALQSA